MRFRIRIRFQGHFFFSEDTFATREIALREAEHRYSKTPVAWTVIEEIEEVNAERR